MEISASWVEEVRVIKVTGVMREATDLDDYERQMLAAAEAALSSGKAIVFDFSELDYMNMTGMRPLLRMYRQSPDTRFAVVLPDTSTIHYEYKSDWFAKVMPRYETLDAALNAVRTASTKALPGAPR